MSQSKRFPRVIELTFSWLAGVVLVTMLGTPALTLAQDTAPEPPAIQEDTTVVEEPPPEEEVTEPPTVETPAPTEPVPPDPATEPPPPSEPDDATVAPTLAPVTLEPEVTVTPDPTTVEPLIYGPATMLVTNGSCALVSATDTVEEGSVVSLRCQSTVDGDWTFSVSDVSSGWLWAFRYGTSPALPTSEEIAAWPVGGEGSDATQQGWTQAIGAAGAPVTIDNAGDGRVVEFFLTPTSSALPDSSGNLSIIMEPFLAADRASLEEESVISPMMVVEGGGGGCVQLSTSDVVSYPAANTRDYVMYKCTWPGTEWQLRIDAITASGWEWAAISGQLAPAQIESNPPTIATIAGWSSGAPTWVTGFAANAPDCPFASTALAAGTTSGNDSNAYYLFLKPRDGSLPGTHGDITIRQIPVAAGPVCAGQAPNPAGSRTSTLTGILAGSTSMTCVKVSPAGSVVTPPDFLRFRCDAGSGNSNQFFIDRIAPGWTWRVLVQIGGQIASQKSGTSTDVYTGTQRPWNADNSFWYVDLIPTSSAVAGSEGYVFVRVTGNNPSARPVTARLGGTRANDVEVPATANDVQLSCSTLTVQALVGSPVTVNCNWSARTSLGARQVTLESITIPAPAGWTLSTVNGVGTVAGGDLTILPNVTISNQNQGYAFSFSLLPSCNATTVPTQTTVGSRFRTSAGLVDGPVANISAARLPGSLTVDVLGAETKLDWNVEYQFAAHPVDGTLGYRVVSSQCGGWSMQIQASAFAYSGPNAGSGIPAANIVVISAAVPIPVVGITTGISVPQISGSSLQSPITALTAAPGAGVGTYHHLLDLRVTIPVSAPPGDYLSTITITSAVGP